VVSCHTISSNCHLSSHITVLVCQQCGVMHYEVSRLSEMLVIMCQITRNISYVVHMILTIKSDYFPKQDYLTGLDYEDECVSCEVENLSFSLTQSQTHKLS
jgi:hypothetical protein